MSKNRELLISKVAYQVVSGLTDKEIMKHHNISQSQLKRILKSRDYEVLSKAYQQLVSVGNGEVSDTLSVKDALGNVVLGFLKPDKRRRDVIELLDAVLDHDVDSKTFLTQYENHHNNGVIWDDLS